MILTKYWSVLRSQANTKELLKKEENAKAQITRIYFWEWLLSIVDWRNRKCRWDVQFVLKTFSIPAISYSYLLNATPSDDRQLVEGFQPFPVSQTLVSQMLMVPIFSILSVTNLFCPFVSSRWRLVASYDSLIDNCHFQWTMD